MLEEALGEAYKSLGAAEEGACVMTCGGDWQPGIVGLVASRLKECSAARLSPSPSTAMSERDRRARSSGVDLGRSSGRRWSAAFWSRAAATPWRRGHRRAGKSDAFQAFLEQALAEQVSAGAPEGGC